MSFREGQRQANSDWFIFIFFNAKKNDGGWAVSNKY
jgi:hypothetical protein